MSAWSLRAGCPTAIGNQAQLRQDGCYIWLFLGHFETEIIEKSAQVDCLGHVCLIERGRRVTGWAPKERAVTSVRRYLGKVCSSRQAAEARAIASYLAAIQAAATYDQR